MGLDKSEKNNIMVLLNKEIEEWCNGSTTDSDSVCWGSNPYSSAMETSFACQGKRSFFLLSG